MMRKELDVGVEFLSDILRDQSLGFLDVFMSEEKLTVEVAQIDRVKVYNVNFAKAGENEIFKQLAADATCANEEDPGLCWSDVSWPSLVSCQTPSHLFYESLGGAQ